MERTKYDLILASLEKGDCMPHKEENTPEFRELEKMGLLKKCRENSYSLTSQGEMIKIMGYETYIAAEELNKKPHVCSTKRLNNYKVAFSLLIASFIILLLIFY